MDTIHTDEQYMAQALRLADRGHYTTHPNPRVGCVLVADRRVVGQGWHQRAGQPHAEVLALAEAGEQARGATAYVSLEPCSHHGRTPPCADALVAAGVARVVVAMQDPNPRVAGRGLDRLRAAGIEVACGVLEHQARALNPGFIQRMTVQRPWVRCKTAMSLDGRTAMASGESKWITGSAARRDVQRLRAASSAIVTGIGTVLADDPAMTVRAEQIAEPPPAGGWRQPLRVVVDSHGQTPPRANILSAHADTLIAVTPAGLERGAQLRTDGVTVVEFPVCREQVDLSALMQHLAGQEINDVLLEAGATLSGAMLQAGLVDELVIYAAPVLMGSEARGLFKLPGLEHMKDRIQLTISDVRLVGDDLRIIATPGVC